jgi:uncharacterized protein (TIGR03084 family)
VTCALVTAFSWREIVLITSFVELMADLAVEGDRLRAAVAGLTDTAWRSATPAVGWHVATQIVHLAWSDEVALLAVRAADGDSDGWDAVLSRAAKDPLHFVDTEAIAGATRPPAAILARWDTARANLDVALRCVEGRVPWFGPPMSPASMATARLMETWAHGLDVYEALGIPPVVTDAIRHVCHLGVRTRDFAYAMRHVDPPVDEFRIELAAPSGAIWVWGPPDAGQGLTGSAYDFARLVTRRIHRDDTTLVAVGEDVERWLGIAQAYAGPAGRGRARAKAG